MLMKLLVNRKKAKNLKKSIDKVKSYFDYKYYRNTYPDLKSCKIDLCEHFMNFGF